MSDIRWQVWEKLPNGEEKKHEFTASQRKQKAALVRKLRRAGTLGTVWDTQDNPLSRLF